MSESFVVKNTATPTTKSADSHHKSSHEHKSSQSPSTKLKKSKDSNTINGLKHTDHPVTSTSPHVNGKKIKTKHVGNAEATTSISQDSPKKSSTKQSSDSSQTLTGTPIKHKLADQTNGNDVTKPFSPRKTRSKVSKIPTDAAATVTSVKAKTKLMLPQSDDANAVNDKKKTRQPKKLNIETLNKNVAALLPGAKRAKPIEKTDGKDDIDSNDTPATEQRLVDLNRNRAEKNLSLRPPTRAGRKQISMDIVEPAVAATGSGLKAKSKLKLPQLDGANDIDDKKSKSKAKAKSRPKPKDDLNSDSDFEPTPQKRIRPKVTPSKPVNKLVARAKKIDQRVFSTDEETDVEANTNKMNFWVEAYAEKEKKWITIDPVKKKVDSVDHVRVSHLVLQIECHNVKHILWYFILYPTNSTETCIETDHLCPCLEQ